MPRSTLIQWRQGTAAQWTAANPILASSEPARETDSGKWKLGDGATVWASLPYQASATNPITSARKAADTTVNNTVTLAADPELSLPVVAGGVYQMEAFLIYSASTIADLSLGWTYPAASTMDWASNALISTITGNTGSLYRGRLAINGVGWAGGSGVGAGSKLVALPSGILTAAASGNLTLTWAQIALDPTDAVVYANSMLKLTRLN